VEKRIAGAYCAGQIVDVHVPLAEGASLEMRSQVEAEIAGLRLERDVFYPEHGVRITLSKAPSLKVQMKIQLVSQNGSVVVETQSTKEGPAILCQAGDLTDGRYKLICLWEGSNGKPITSVAYDIYKLIPTSPLVGYEHMEERKLRGARLLAITMIADILIPSAMRMAPL